MVSSCNLTHPASCFPCSALTENTRVSYPIDFIANARIPCVGPHPKNIILLCCDAFGVLPPVSRLTTQQAMYHFISGYTAKVQKRFENKVLEAASRYVDRWACWESSCPETLSGKLCNWTWTLHCHVLTTMRNRPDPVHFPQVAGTEQGVTEPEATFSGACARVMFKCMEFGQLSAA